MSLILQPPWTRQPQGAVEIDWSNPLTRGLRLAYSPADRLERVSNKFILTTGSVPKGFGLRSSGATFTNSTSNYLGSTTNGSPIQTTTADYRMSLLAVVIPNSTATQQVFVALNGTGTQRTNLQLSAAGQPGYLVRQVNGGTAAGVTATQTVSVGQQVVIGGVTYAQNSHTVYVNGISGGTTTTSLTSGDSTYDRHYIGIDFPGSIGASAPARALIQLVLGWNRALSAAEMYALSANPWQIFKPVQRTFVNTLSAAADAFQSDAFQTDAFQTSAATGVNHATSGVLVGPGATVAGTAARVAGHVTTGDLIGPGSTLSGSASRFRAFDTSGVLTGQGSTLSGSASRFRTFDTTGVLAGQGATVTGAANRFRAFDTSGVLNGPGAIIVGSAARSAVAVTHDTTGTLVGPGAVIDGQAEYISLYPDPSVVLAGVQYGPGGIYVGTLTVGVGQRIIRLRSFTESD